MWKSVVSCWRLLGKKFTHEYYTILNEKGNILWYFKYYIFYSSVLHNCILKLPIINIVFYEIILIKI